MPQEERFRRLLRWYPRAWRDMNGEVLIGTMLERADETGRDAPTPAEHLAAVGHGLGTRLDARLALRAALAALAVSGVAGILAVWAFNQLSAVGASWVLPTLTIAIAPGLVAVATAALARQRGLLSEPRAVVVVLLSALALTAAAVALVAWGMAFDAADQDVPGDGLAAAWPLLFLGGWTIGAAAIAVFADALFRRTQLRPTARLALAVVAGTLCAPAIGAGLMSPYTAGICAAAAALASVLPTWSARRARVAAPTTAPIVAKPIPARTRRLARLLAGISAVCSGIGVAYALTGSGWGGHADGTAAMGQGITIALISALPLLAAVGALATATGRTRSLDTWGPLVLTVLALGAVAIGYQGAPAWEHMVAGFAVGSVLSGAAIAWWTARRLPGNPRARVAIAVLIGFVYAAILGILVLPMLAFALPLLAAAFAIRTPGRPRDGSVGEIVPSGSALPSTS